MWGREKGVGEVDLEAPLRDPVKVEGRPGCRGGGGGARGEEQRVL